MSIRFSEVTLSDPTGLTIQVLVDGHPDADDFDDPIQVSVQQYCYLTDSSEEDADCNHFALIRAYDELAELCNSLKPTRSVGLFTDRDDVEHGGYFTFTLEEESPC
ncbi:MAG: hypothetical protein RR949_02745 [Oscillospiraceae bacterium]